MSVPFYLLGLLIRFGPQHGYRLKQMVEDEIADFAKIKMPNIYYHLNKLCEEGYLSFIQNREGNRPEKSVYQITDEGRTYFGELAKKISDAEYQTEFRHDGLLFFLDLIDSEYILSSLTASRDALSERIKYLNRHKQRTVNDKPGQAAFLTQAIFDHHLSHMETELQWLNQVLEGLSRR